MPEVTDIGAGSVFKMCSAATPMSAHTAGGSDDNLVDYSANIKSVPLENSQGTEDITTLASAALAFATSHLATLFNPTFQTGYIDNAQGTFFLPASAVRTGTNHDAGRGVVDAAVFIGGEVTGNLRADFSMIITNLPFGIMPGAAFGGNLTAQITGGIVFTTQS